MSKIENINHSNDESSAGKFGDQPTLLSGNTISNEAEGGNMTTTTATPVATLSEQSRKPVPARDIPELIRRRYRLSPAVQKLVDENRQHLERQREAFREEARDIIEGFKRQMASALKLDPHAFVQVPDDVLDELHAASQTAKALEGIPGMKINVTFTSEVTVNGVRVPDEE